jgi:hypothetical protein
MQFAESTIRGKDSPDRQKARGWDGRFARTECCSAERWDAQNITELDQVRTVIRPCSFNLMPVDHRRDLLAVRPLFRHRSAPEELVKQMADVRELGYDAVHEGEARE